MRRLALLLSLVACGDAGDAPRHAAPGPNVLLALADDLGWGDVGYHGSEIRTPVLDRLASEGARLEAFHAQPTCTPSRAALLTGRYPHRYGLQGVVVRPWTEGGLPTSERTLAERLRDAGYRTALVGKWHLGHSAPRYLPLARGFDAQYGTYHGSIDYWRRFRAGGLDWSRDQVALEEEGYATTLLADEAVRIVREHDFAAPLLLYLAFTAPHTPLEAPADTVASYAHLEDEERRVYAAMVTELDTALGRVLDAFAERGQRARTLTLFLSDNGGEVNGSASNGALRGGKGRSFEGGVRVPAIAHWPERIAPRAIDVPLHLVDVAPTLTSLAGRAAEGFDGVDLGPLLERDLPLPERALLLQLTSRESALREGRWKLVRSLPRRDGRADPTRPMRTQLFDLDADPEETANVAAEHPEVAERLRTRLDAWASSAASPLESPPVAPPGFQAPETWAPRR